jgi:GNAT superfamily N-acetyltransferase
MEVLRISMTRIHLERFVKNLQEALGLFDLVLEPKGKTMVLKSLALRKNDRGSGIGSEALTGIEDYCLKNGYTQITLQPAGTVMGFYSKNGYTGSLAKMSKDLVPPKRPGQLARSPLNEGL